MKINSITYWTPGGVGRQHLQEIGLGHLATPDVSIEQECAQSSRDGKAGILWRPKPTGQGALDVEFEQPLANDPVNQTWYKCGTANDPYYIGLWNGVAYGPEDFLRPEPVDGYTVQMDDGNRWWVPEIPALPMRHMRNPDGSKKLVSFQEHRAACEAADRLFQAYMVPEARQNDDETTRKDLCEVLGLNYRIGLEESEILGLFSTRSCWATMQWALGLQKVREILDFHAKLQEQAKNVGEAGAAADSPTPPSSDTSTAETA